jgi:hypothetical protein
MIKFHEIENSKVAELKDANLVISSAQEALDLIGETVNENCSFIILQEKNLHSDFYKLHTGLAGDILQKFSNYNFRLAVIGDFTKYKSKNLQDFIRESNKGNRIFFIESLDAAFKKCSVILRRFPH